MQQFVGSALYVERLESSVIMSFALIHSLQIQTEFSYKQNPKLLQQLQYCEDEDIPFAIIIGETELKNDIVKIRDIKTRKEVGLLGNKIV